MQLHFTVICFEVGVSPLPITWWPRLYESNTIQSCGKILF